MKFLHTADLHLGKSIYEFSMLEEQRHMLQEITDIAVKEKVAAIVIAGDVYDRAIPSAEAVSLLDAFLTNLCRLSIPAILVGGNHDCGERLGFGREMFKKQGIYIAGQYEEEMRQVTLEDEFGEVVFVLLPFMKPSAGGGRTSGEAVEAALKNFRESADFRKRHVLVTHFFVTNGREAPELSGGEAGVYVGGIDSVDAFLFQDFDYTALGHIHRFQQIGGRAVYYAGAPIKYSFSESHDEKSVNIVKMAEKGTISVQKVPLTPIHDMRIIQGGLEELISPEIVAAENREDYLQVRLTNTEELIDPIGTLRSVYPNVMQMTLTKNETQEKGRIVQSVRKSKSMTQLFEEFYEVVRDEKMDEEREKIVRGMIRKTEGEESL